MKVHRTDIHSRRALTFLEIVIALAVLAVAMLPIFAVIHKGASDTDINNSQTYAITKATDTLDAILDNVPFEFLRRGNPGFLRCDDIINLSAYSGNYSEDWLGKMAETLFNGSEKKSEGWECRGTLTDIRGIVYRITMRIDDLPASPAPSGEKPEMINVGSSYPDSEPTEFPFHSRGDFTFSFLKNPKKLADPNWCQEYKPYNLTQRPRWETELTSDGHGVSEPSDNIYLEPDFISPDALRYTQRMASEKVNYAAGDDYVYCTMKRLVVEVQWNIERHLYKDPDAPSPQRQKVHLITLKGDISR